MVVSDPAEYSVRTRISASSCVTAPVSAASYIAMQTPPGATASRLQLVATHSKTSPAASMDSR